MGGKSFTKAASRLNTTQLEALTKYCQIRLEKIFPRTERLRCIRSKTSHGDLDLLSAFDRPDISLGPAQIGISSADVGPANAAHPPNDNTALCREFCDEVKHALGANGWIIASFGYPIIALQVPCTVLGPTQVDHEEDHDAFWQVDIALTSSSSFDAYLFSCSYNIVFALLVLAAQTMSSALWLRRDSLSLRHRPFDSQPLVEITLIGNREELYRWFGFDFSRWKLGFENYEEIYKWITNVPEDGVLAQAWKKLAAGEMDETKLEYRRFYTRMNGIPEFVTWLKTQWKPAKHPLNTTPHESDATHHISNSTLSKSHPDSTPSACPTPKDPHAGSTSSACPTPLNPLDPFASEVLDQCGQTARCAEEVEKQRMEVLRIAEVHKRREMNRLKAAQEQEAARLRRLNAQNEGEKAPVGQRDDSAVKAEASST